MSEINGFFVRGGKLAEKDPDFWIYCWVRIDCIKTIDQNMKHKEYCHFYTYKDEWYSCQMSADELMESINKALSSSDLVSNNNKGFLLKN